MFNNVSNILTSNYTDNFYKQDCTVRLYLGTELTVLNPGTELIQQDESSAEEYNIIRTWAELKFEPSPFAYSLQTLDRKLNKGFYKGHKISRLCFRGTFLAVLLKGH